MANAEPWTIAKLSRLALAHEPPLTYFAISHAMHKLKDDRVIEPVAGAAQAVGDGIRWKDRARPTMAQGPMARAYRLTSQGAGR